MDEIYFIIHGNPDNDDGNPLGYKRMLKQHMREDAARYLEWQRFVREAFEDAHPDIWMGEDDKFPLTTSKVNHARMDIVIEYASDVHRSDPDNVYKGVADSLFRNDRYLMAGSYEASISPEGKGRVIVRIKFK